MRRHFPAPTFFTVLVLTASLLHAQQLQKRKTTSPLDALPKNIELLNRFGERADFSPGNRQIAFMAKSFGDAFVIDLKTRVIRCVTCAVPGAAFLRIMHLSNGDYILIGPERFKDIRASRSADNELWYLSRQPNSKPVRFGQHMSEGAAISKTSLRMAWSETPSNTPELPAGASRLVTAEVDLVSQPPKLVNRKVVYES